MSGVLKIAGMGIGATVVFSGSVALMLFSRGDLNREGLSRVPVIGNFIDIPDEDVPMLPEGIELPEGAPDLADSEPSPPSGPDDTPPEPVGEVDEISRDIFGRGDVYDPGELGALVAELRDAKDRYRTRLAALDATEDRLDIVAEELADRREHLEGLREEVELGRVELERERARLEQDRVLYSEGETENFKSIAKTYDMMSPEEAVAGLGELDVEDAVKVLTEMNSRKAGKVLAAFPPAKMGEITRKMKGLVREQPTGTGKK